MVQPATEADLAAVVRIAEESIEAPQWAKERYAGIVRPNAGRRRVLFVAKKDKGVVGFAVASEVAGEAELESVVVRPEARRAGVGVLLCAAVAGWAAEQGAQAVFLEVRRSNTTAQRLYLRAGFKVTGDRRSYYQNPAEDAVLMTLHLNGATHL